MRLPTLLRRVQRNAAVQDGLLTALYGYLLLRALLAGGREMAPARWLTGISFALLLVWLLGTRGEWLGPGCGRAVGYRIGLTALVFAGYPMMGVLLPSLGLELRDAQLLGLDEVLFGRTVAHGLQPWVTPRSVEWFAFFYFSYYWLLPLFGLFHMVSRASVRLTEFATAVSIVTCVAYVLYTLVPAVGPHVGYPFEVALEGGFWWRQVWRVVDAAGAQIDIFPSLHTAFPTLFALHAWRHRGERVFRYAWLPLAFLAANITIATVFLRWHYGVDTLAGLLLAVALSGSRSSSPPRKNSVAPRPSSSHARRRGKRCSRRFSSGSASLVRCGLLPTPRSRTCRGFETRRCAQANGAPARSSATRRIRCRWAHRCGVNRSPAPAGTCDEAHAHRSGATPRWRTSAENEASGERQLLPSRKSGHLFAVTQFHGNVGMLAEQQRIEENQAEH